MALASWFRRRPRSEIDRLAEGLFEAVSSSAALFKGTAGHTSALLEAGHFFLHLTSPAALSAYGHDTRTQLHHALAPTLLQRIMEASGVTTPLTPEQMTWAQQTFAASYLDRDVVYAKCTSWLSEDPFDTRAVFGRYANYVRGGCHLPDDLEVTQAIIGAAYGAFTASDHKSLVLSACGVLARPN